MNKSKPQISIVLVGRNDNYGGDFAARLQHSVAHTLSGIEKFGIHAELLFVNYNPLEEPPVSTFIDWKTTTARTPVRIITVPNAVHTQVLSIHSCKPLPVLEYIAKNAGIKRATGEYILCMNPDVLLPDEVFKTMQSLKSDCYYIADRIDFLDYENNKPAHLSRIHLTGHVLPYTKHSAFNLALTRFKNKLLCTWKFNSVNFKKLFDFLEWKVYYNNIEYKLHGNAAGDCMLMHKSKWQLLRGYNEHTFLPLHVDSIMVVQAAAAGLCEKVFSEPVLHREHERRFTSNTDNADEKMAYEYFQTEAKRLLHANKNYSYNREDWGLANFTLPEIQL